MRPGQLSWRDRGWLWFRIGIRLVVAAVLLSLLAVFGRPALALFAPFVAALVMAALLNPLVKWCQRKVGLSRPILTAFVLLLVFGALGGAVGFLLYSAAGELVSLAQNWKGLLQSFQAALDQMESLFANLWTAVPPQMNETMESVVEGLLQWLNTTTPKLLNTLVDYTTNKAMRVPSFVVALVIFLMATYFLTVDYPYLRSRVTRGMGDGLLHFCSQVRATALGAFGGYLRAQFLLSVGVFFILLAGFLITGQPYSLLLALGLAALDFIPILGAGAVLIPWAVLALITGDYRSTVEMLVIWGIVAVFRRVMEPKFVGDQTGLSPILSLVSIYVGMKLAGVLGMILGPICMLVLINLSRMGMFRGVRQDLTAAARDVAAILATDPEPR